MGGLIGLRGRFDDARRSVAEARRIHGDLGHAEGAVSYCGGLAADIELAAGEYSAAEGILRAICDFFQSTRNRSELGTRAADLAEALYYQGQLDEADDWTEVSRTSATSDYLSAKVAWRTVRAKILARGGELKAADDLVRGAIRLAESSDGLNRQAKAQGDRAEILLLAGRSDEAASAFDRALELYERSQCGEQHERCCHQQQESQGHESPPL